MPFITQKVLPWFLGHHWCAESAESLFINWQNFPALNWMHKNATWECLNTCFQWKFQIQLVPAYILNSNTQNLANTQILKPWGVLSVSHIANDTWCYFEYILHIEASKHDQTNTPNKEHNQNILWNFFRSCRQAKSIPANTSKYSPLDEYNKSLELECSNAGKTWPTVQIPL